VNFWKRFTQLNFQQLYSFLLLFLSHPLLIIPVFKATKKTIEVCNSLYGNKHQGNGKANGFRHALWNVLICINCFKIVRNKQKAVFFTQKLTDLYEKVTQNEILDRTMDLHNNTVGRICFLNFLDENEEKNIHFLQNMVENALKCSNIEQIKKAENRMVYLSEE